MTYICFKNCVSLTIEMLLKMFKNSYFNKERHDLSEAGRVKLNSKLDLDRDLKDNTLNSLDRITTNKFMLDLRDGKGDVDDIDHLGKQKSEISRRTCRKSQFRIGLLKEMERHHC